MELDSEQLTSAHQLQLEVHRVQLQSDLLVVVLVHPKLQLHQT